MQLLTAVGVDLSGADGGADPLGDGFGIVQRSVRHGDKKLLSAVARHPVVERLQFIHSWVKSKLVLDVTCLFHPIDGFCAELWSLQSYYQNLGKRFVIEDDAKLCGPYCEKMKEAYDRFFFPDRY